jgi:hypothetical protein
MLRAAWSVPGNATCLLARYFVSSSHTGDCTVCEEQFVGSARSLVRYLDMHSDQGPTAHVRIAAGQRAVLQALVLAGMVKLASMHSPAFT